MLNNYELLATDNWHLSSVLRIFTTVERTLQITPFYSKQTQFPKGQNEHNIFYNKGIGKKSNFTFYENKPNSNPIKAITNPIKANKMPKQTQYEPNQTQFQTQKNLFGCPKNIDNH
jgi:hypothetical protein